MGLFKFLKHAWNTLTGYDPSDKQVSGISYINLGSAFSSRPDRIYIQGSEKTIVGSIYNRIAVDVSMLLFKHIRTDKDGKYVETIHSGLNDILNIEANIDQTSDVFIRDTVLQLLDKSSCVHVPIELDESPKDGRLFDIKSMRIARVLQEYPQHMMVEVYDERTGVMVTRTFPKRQLAIIESPLFAITNSPDSIANRLIRKISLLDAVDEQSGSGKLDLVVQLPYIMKTDYQKKLAADRKASIEDQLKNSPYGIVYTDATEKVVQLNRPVENNIMKSTEYLTSMLLGQFGMTQGIMDNTADEKEMLNYTQRTLIPFAEAICKEYNRKFLTPTARSYGHTIAYFSDPFKLVPMEKIADIADKFTRNEILSSNEIRQKIGMLPVKDPRADELRNKNLNPTEGQKYATTNNSSKVPEYDATRRDKDILDTPIMELLGLDEKDNE